MDFKNTCLTKWMTALLLGIVSDSRNSRSVTAFLLSILYNVIDSDSSLSKVGLSTSIFFGGFTPASLKACAKVISASVKTLLIRMSDIIAEYTPSNLTILYSVTLIRPRVVIHRSLENVILKVVYLSEPQTDFKRYN